MPWLKSSDDAPEDPDVWRLSDGAYRLWDACRHYAQRTQSDAYVPTPKLRFLVPRYRPAHLAELLDNPADNPLGALLTACPDDPRGPGYIVRNHAKYNRTRADWEADAAKNAAKQAAFRARRAAQEELPNDE